MSTVSSPPPTTTTIYDVCMSLPPIVFKDDQLEFGCSGPAPSKAEGKSTGTGKGAVEPSNEPSNVVDLSLEDDEVL